MPDFHVEWADWALDRDTLQDLRRKVFIDEQNVPEQEEWDGLDDRCRHALAVATDGTPIGCGRLLPGHRVGRMAVLADWRGRGVGAALLEALVERARAEGASEVRLHAQVSARDFYGRYGFEAFGPWFLDAGIEHQRMRKLVEPMPEPPPERGKPRRRPAVEALQCTTSESMRTAALQLIDQATRQIRLHSRDVVPLLADDDGVGEALRAVATSGRNASIRVLLGDADSLLRQGHRLIQLAQKLETAIQIRVITERQDCDYNSAFLLNDRGGYLLQAQLDRPQARGSTCAPGRAAQLGNYFDEVWQRATPATALRRLDI